MNRKRARQYDLERPQDEVKMPKMQNIHTNFKNEISNIYVSSTHAKSSDIAFSSFHSNILIEMNNLLSPNKRINIEHKRNIFMKELRSYYDTLIAKSFKGMIITPKESFNRWMMERSLFASKDSLFPSPINQNVGFSSLLFREIEEDIPIKLNMFPNSMHDLRRTVKRFFSRCKAILDGSNGLNFKSIDFSKKEVEFIKKNKSNVRETLNGIDVKKSLEQFRVIKNEVSKVFQKKLGFVVEEVVKNVEKMSHHYADKIKEYKSEIMKNEEDSSGYNIRWNFENEKSFVRIAEKGRNGFVRLNKFHSNKLKQLYLRKFDDCVIQDDNEYENLNDVTKSFRQDVFLLLCRYENFFGNTRPFEGAGHQGSIPNKVMNVLHHFLGVEMECFASPFNCYFNRYCSAFKETDMAFGSVGSFFDFNPSSGSFEANPPFVEELSCKMIFHMEKLIEKANTNMKPLSFVIVLPNWEDANSIISLKESKFLKKTIVLEKNEHSYISGFQHKTQKSQFYNSVHETRLFFLQSEEGSSKWEVKDDIVDKIVSSFKSSKNTSYRNPFKGRKGSYQRSGTYFY